MLMHSEHAHAQRSLIVLESFIEPRGTIVRAQLVFVVKEGRPRTSSEYSLIKSCIYIKNHTSDPAKRRAHKSMNNPARAQHKLRKPLGL